MKNIKAMTPVVIGNQIDLKNDASNEAGLFVNGI